MKYLSVRQQINLLKNDDFDRLTEYAKVHNLNQRVVLALLAKIKELQSERREAASIH